MKTGPRIFTNQHESQDPSHRDYRASLALFLGVLPGLCGLFAFHSCRFVWISGLVFASCALAESTQLAVRFEAVDVFVDPQGQSLGAYQVEFKATGGDVKLVGVEGGEPEAYRKAPYYDPKAIQQSRIIIAAFSADSSLPNTRTRVARLHLQISGDAKPEYELKLMVAGDKDAKPIEAVASYTPYQEEKSAAETQRRREE